MNQNNPHLMGTEPIGKLLLQYSIPAIIGMTIVSLYNIIDSIFIGHGVGPMAIPSRPSAWDRKTWWASTRCWAIR